MAWNFDLIARAWIARAPLPVLILAVPILFCGLAGWMLARAVSDALQYGRN